MNNFLRGAAAPALLAFAFTTGSAWAQAPASDAALPPANAQAGSHVKKHPDFVEQRIDELHAALKITDQQSQQWDAFAQTMRDNAKNADQAFRERAGKLASMSADEAMKSYASVAQLHAENMQKLATAFSALYATFSDEQKKTADVLFRNEHEHGKRHGPQRQHQSAAGGAASAPAPASD